MILKLNPSPMSDNEGKTEILGHVDLGTKNRINFPAKAARALGMQVGDTLVIKRLEDGKVIIYKLE